MKEKRGKMFGSKF
jgi:hypothetical protein